MIKSGLDLLMLLLYANEQEKIEGITKLLKLLFLLIKEEKFKEFEKEYGFEACNYGPWVFSSSRFYRNHTGDGSDEIRKT